MSTVSLINYSQPPKPPKPTTKFARLIAKTPSNAFDYSTVKEQVAHCARVSNPLNQNNDAPSSKLLSYLMEHKHWSPFEMVSVCLEINTTRDIARQILRHRSFSFQEFSQRYADPTGHLGFEKKEARMQDQKNRQNSIELTEKQNYKQTKLKDNWNDQQSAVLATAAIAYQWAIDHGIAKEQARAVFPEGITNSRMYMNGTLRSWIHYIELRTGPETQKEHRIVAQQCAEAIEPFFPDIMQFVNNS